MYAIMFASHEQRSLVCEADSCWEGDLTPSHDKGWKQKIATTTISMRGLLPGVLMVVITNKHDTHTTPYTYRRAET